MMLKFRVNAVIKELKKSSTGLDESYTIICLSNQNGIMEIKGLNHAQFLTFQIGDEINVANSRIS